MSFTTKLNQFHQLLQKALEVELFTIPPYLTALYSIRDGAPRDATDILQSVAMEEMLHAALVSNLMNATGARPQCVPGMGPGGPTKRYYPAQTPHISRPLFISLLPFSREAIEGFRAIEAPENPDDWDRNGGVATIGQLYDRIRNRLIDLVEDAGEAKVFTGKPELQLTREDYYGGGGGLLPVRGLQGALAAIEVIAQQGEGLIRTSNLTGDEVRFKQPKEVAHFYRFEQILAGRYYDRDDDVDAPSGTRLLVDWDAVWPIGEVPGDQPPPGPDGLPALWEGFGASYEGLLTALHRAFNGEKSALHEAVPAMQALKVQAIELMRIALPDGKTCPPPFWFLQS